MEKNIKDKENREGPRPKKSTEQLIQEICGRYMDESYIKASMVPDLDLYVDQITTFMSRHLTKTVRSDDEKIMTKTMINNYTKNHLLPPPEKKKYSRDHVLLLIFIYYFKNFLPISDIQTILTPLTERYFHKENRSGSTAKNQGGKGGGGRKSARQNLTLDQVYSTLFSKESTLVESLFENIQDEFGMSREIFEDVPEAEREYLQEFAFICILSLDIYIKKQLIEALIDR